MRNLFAIALCVTLLAAAPKTRPASRPEDAPAAPAFAPDTQYDKFKDLTTVTLGPSAVKLDKGDGRRFLLLSTTFKGETSRGIHSEILVSVLGKPGSFVGVGDGPMIFLLDGKRRVEIQAFAKIKKEEGDAVVYAIGDNELTKINAADKVECQGAGVEFTLTDEQQTGLKAFAKALENKRFAK